ncbi:hypothetical protein [Saccharopolyspora spinosa]
MISDTRRSGSVSTPMSSHERRDDRGLGPHPDPLDQPGLRLSAEESGQRA